MKQNNIKNNIKYMGEVFLLMYLPIKMQFVLVLISIFLLLPAFLKTQEITERQTIPNRNTSILLQTDNRVIYFLYFKKKSIGYRIVQLIKKIIYSKTKGKTNLRKSLAMDDK